MECKKNLIILTNSFPFGTSEPYLETEANFYEGHFDNIYICSFLYFPQDYVTVRELPSEKFKVLAIPKAKNSSYFSYSYKCLFDINFYKEIRKLVKQQRFSFSTLKSLIIFLSRSYHELNIIQKWLNNQAPLLKQQTGTFYSYRLDYQSYILSLLKKSYPNFKFIARGHGFDLYEERRSNNYIPLREYILDNLTKAVMISKAGIEYIKAKFKGHDKNLILSRLGTLDYETGPSTSNPKELKIVSCSTINEVKRIHLIVEALSYIKDINIIWDHYGDGPLENQICQYAKQKLSNNINFNLKGFVSNKKLMEIYKTVPYDIFINTSSSEGVPVSIMEAMSFGIPIIATDAGGTSEIVKDKIDGYILPIDFNPIELAHILQKMHKLSPQQKETFRTNARKDWQLTSSASNNYPNFIEKILS